MNRKLKKIAAEAKKHSITLPEDGFFSEYYKVEKNYMGLFLKGDIIKIDKIEFEPNHVFHLKSKYHEDFIISIIMLAMCWSEDAIKHYKPNFFEKIIF